MTRPESDPDQTGQSIDETAVHARLRADHGPVLDAIAAVADAVESRGPTTDGQALADALEAGFAEMGILDRLPSMLATAVDAAGLTLAADPVAAPPYVAITSRGPVLRGSTPEGRLVVVLTTFGVERAPKRYVRTPAPDQLVVRVDFKR